MDQQSGDSVCAQHCMALVLATSTSDWAFSFRIGVTGHAWAQERRLSDSSPVGSLGGERMRRGQII